MPWHRDFDLIPLALQIREYLFKPSCCTFCFWFASIDGIFEVVECLSYRIGVANFSVIDEGDVFDTPSD